MRKVSHVATITTTYKQAPTHTDTQRTYPMRIQRANVVEMGGRGVET